MVNVLTTHLISAAAVTVSCKQTTCLFLQFMGGEPRPLAYSRIYTDRGWHARPSSQRGNPGDRSVLTELIPAGVYYIKVGHVSVTVTSFITDVSCTYSYSISNVQHLLLIAIELLQSFISIRAWYILKEFHTKIHQFHQIYIILKISRKWLL